MPKATFCGGREHKKTISFFFPWTLIVLWNSNPEKIANIERIERDGINFVSEVFVAFTVVIAQVP